MRPLPIMAILVTAALSTAGQGQEITNGVIRLDPALDEIISPDTKAEQIVNGFKFLEGPVWVPKGGFLLFSEMRDNKIVKWNPADRKTSSFLDRPSVTITEGQEVVTSSNGLTLDPQGRLVYCSRGDRTIVRLEPDGRRTVLASEYEGKPLGRVNDLVYRSDGALYFTTPSLSRAPGPNDGRVYLLKDGKLQVAVTSDPNVALRHNGIALSPDGKILYLADNTGAAQRKIVRYDVKPDGTVTNGRVLIDMSGAEGNGAPDGIKVDQRGNVYGKGPATSGSGMWIISPAGKHLGTFIAPTGFTNMAFGDADGKTLYSVGGGDVYRIRLKVAGVRP